MKNLIILLLIAAVGGYFIYTRIHKPEWNYERQGDSLRVAAKGIECHLKLEEEAREEGFVIDFALGDRGPAKVFSGIFTFMRDEVAAELALNKDKSKLSSEAQAIINRDGCAANFLNQNLFHHTLIADNTEVDQALRSLKKGDKVLLKGYNASIRTLTMENSPVSVQTPDIFCVSYAEINGEVFSGQ